MVEMSRPGHLCKELTRVKHSGVAHAAGTTSSPQRLSPDPPRPHMPLVHSSIPVTLIFQELLVSEHAPNKTLRCLPCSHRPSPLSCSHFSTSVCSHHPDTCSAVTQLVHLAQEADVCPCCRSPPCAQRLQGEAETWRVSRRGHSQDRRQLQEAVEMPVVLSYLTQAAAEEQTARKGDMGTMKRFSRWGALRSPRSRGRKGAGGDKGQTWGGLSAGR